MSSLTVVETIVLICGVLATGFMIWVFCMFTEQLSNARKAVRRSEADTTEFRVVPMNARTEPPKPGIWW
jgi:hypothetical protein